MLSQPEACALLSGCPFGSRGHPRTCSGQDSLLTCTPAPSPTGQGGSGGRGCARVCVCTPGAGVESTDTSSCSGLWSPGAPRNASLCVVCVLCVCSYLTSCLRLSGSGCGLCVCVSGRGWGGAGPSARLCQRLSDHSSSHSRRRTPAPGHSLGSPGPSSGWQGHPLAVFAVLSATAKS